MTPQEIKKRLSRGDINEIARRTNRHRDTVRLVLDGVYGETFPCYVPIMQAIFDLINERDKVLGELSCIAQEIQRRGAQRQPIIGQPTL